MRKLKKMAYYIGIAGVLSIASFSTFGNNNLRNINTNIVSAASSKTPVGLKYAKERSSVHKSNAPQKYQNKIYNVSVSDFDSAIMQDYYKEYRSTYPSATFTNSKYEAICKGTTRGFGLDGKFYIFTEGFTLTYEYNNNSKLVIYVHKATAKEHSYYIAEKKKYYKYLGQRHKGCVYTYNFLDGNRYVTIQYNTEKSVLTESSSY